MISPSCVCVSVTSTFELYHWFKKKHGTHIMRVRPTPNTAPCNFLQSVTVARWTGKPMSWEAYLKNADTRPCQHTAQIHTENSYPTHGEPQCLIIAPVIGNTKRKLRSAYFSGNGVLAVN